MDGDTSGFHGAYKLINIHHLVTFLKIFLHVLISEASKYNMYKFYQIASNSLQVIHIVHERFDCPSYTVVIQYKSWLAMETVRYFMCPNEFFLEDFFPHLVGPSEQVGTHAKLSWGCKVG